MCVGDGTAGQLIDKPQKFLNSTALFGRIFSERSGAVTIFTQVGWYNKAK